MIRKYKKLIILSILLPSFEALASHPVKLIEATMETAAIPRGENDADDPAIWVNYLDMNQSRILGTSKYDEDPQDPGGLAVYNLKGEMLQFLPVGKLNNVDTIQDQNMAIASNRLNLGLSIFTIDPSGTLEHALDLPITDDGVTSIEPYGLCAGRHDDRVFAFVTFHDGSIRILSSRVQAPLALTPWKKIPLSNFVRPEQDAWVRWNIFLDLKYNDELEEYEEELEERFVLEGCAYDKEYDRLFVGMERLGVWLIENISQENHSEPLLIWPIISSYTQYDPEHWSGFYHLADDVEGIGIYKSSQNKGSVVVSSQGISEYVVFDRKDLSYQGAFQISFGSDRVTETDGLELSSSIVTSAYPEGIMVVHDDENTNEDGSLENGNFKVVSWLDVRTQLHIPY